jgi:hypothetical protein
MLYFLRMLLFSILIINAWASFDIVQLAKIRCLKFELIMIEPGRLPC